MAKKQNNNKNTSTNNATIPQTEEEMAEKEVNPEEVEIQAAPSTRSDREEREKRETREMEGVELERPLRAQKYERIRETEIPPQIKEMFNNYGWNVRFVRWAIDGDVDNRYLAKRIKQDKYQFVTKKEIPEWYLSFFEERELKDRNSALVQGDVVLMKNPLEVVDQRNEETRQNTLRELEAVDSRTVANKQGQYSKYSSFVDAGSRSSVSQKEPRFQE